MRSRLSEARCGTPSGWTRHKRKGEQPCDACVTAKREYDKAWRAAPDRTQKSRMHARAQGRANTALARNHPAEYRTLYAAFLAQVYDEQGLTAPEVRS